MDGTQTVDRVLSALGDPEADAGCRALARRFRDALRRANPDLSEAQLAAYDRTFEHELGPLKTEVRQARLSGAREALTDEDLAVMERMSANPEFDAFMALVRRLGPVVARATQDVFRSEGVNVHRRSAEAAFEA